MFKRLILEDWTHVVPILAFALTFLVFLYFVIRAFMLKRSHLEHLAQLPLDEEQPEPALPKHS